MDSHLFRHFARELEPEFCGRRLQKIYSPCPGVHTIDIGNGPMGRYLLLRHGNKDPWLFTSAEKPRNPDSPEAGVMWLRKRLQGRRLRDQHCDWPGRRLAWELSGLERGFLVLDLREGMRLEPELPAGFDNEPSWPDMDTVLEASHLWREHPHVSPALRKTLTALPADAALSLYNALKDGNSSGYHVYIYEDAPDGDGPRVEALPWALPASLAKNALHREFPTAWQAAAHAGAVAVFSRFSQLEDAGDRQERKKALKKRKRALAKLAQEEERMRGLVALRKKGQALQASLWQLEQGRKLHSIEVQDVEPDASGTLPNITIDLDPSLTIAENMARFFRLAAKGERGLPLVAARHRLMQEELEALRSGKTPASLESSPPPRQPAPEQKGGKKRKDAGKDDKGVQRFRTSDGFLLIRGRNKAANHKLLSQAASQYDLWFHAQDGPGAHLILKRDHPRQEPPQQSMEEAAVLAGLKGWQSQDEKARVICAMVKDVRKRKGADLGQVAVDKVLAAFNVRLDQTLEERLRVE